MTINTTFFKAWGIGIIYDGPDKNPLAPAWLRDHMLAFMLFPIVLEITWGRR